MIYDNIYEPLIIETTKNDEFFIPKYRLLEKNTMDIVPDFPVNKKMEYNEAKMIQAIQNGMILLIKYEGDEDMRIGGGERVIYPMVLGVNKNTKNILIRGWHVDGFSVREQRNTKKVWRLFKADNILWMSFTGNFFRLAPKNYKMNDRLMTERTIMRADFNQIRRNQNNLIQAGKIETDSTTDLTAKENVPTIEVSSTEYFLDLKNPWNNEILKNEKNNADKIKITILKTIIGNEFVCVLGAIGTPGRTVKLMENNKAVGIYKVEISFTGNDFNKYKLIKSKSIFKIFLFKNKK
jgi:hypothetical protein